MAGIGHFLCRITNTGSIGNKTADQSFSVEVFIAVFKIIGKLELSEAQLVAQCDIMHVSATRFFEDAVAPDGLPFIVQHFSAPVHYACQWEPRLCNARHRAIDLLETVRVRLFSAWKLKE